jgi:hypothetical protein
MIDESVRRLQHARELVSAGKTAEALEQLEALERSWQPEQGVTTTEAAHFLGIRSINTLKALLKVEGIPTTRNGNRIMVPLGELLRLRESQRVLRIRASDTAHASSFASDAPLSQAEMDVLHDTRPGTLPWDRD